MTRTPYELSKSTWPSQVRRRLKLPTGFNDLDATVLGISVDSPWANAGFSDKYNLEFDLLSDIDRSVVKSYDVLFEGLGGIEGYTCANRAVFIVKNGDVKYKWVAPSPGEEPNYDEIQEKLKEI